ncbi:MAG TPA: NAD-dependent DNA ligase LigA [Saprospiraceae bacterium]|nr:NAD-dependent DNA ligase LigA [Saprospiraceae bacterium]
MYTKREEKELYDLSKSLLAGKDKRAPKEVAADLRRVITYHEWKYYVQNDPVISDYEYDLLFKQLQELEAEHPKLKTADSPTQRVSSDLSPEFETVRHKVPMLSLDNSYNANDLYKFDEQVRKLTGEKHIIYSVEPKLDGGSIALLYEDDVLVRAATRGNGREGEEMTPNARAMRSIPLRVAFTDKGIQQAEVRGEAVIRKDVFHKLNKQRQEEGLILLANARNSATGGLRTKDPSETAERGIEAYMYQLAFARDKYGKDAIPIFRSHHESMDLIADLGFRIVTKGRKLCKDIEAVIAFCETCEQERDDFPYEIDGMVVKVDSFALQEKCGSTSHHPRWAVAYKFKARQATSKLLNVEYQIGKTGTITPVAKLTPVALAGVTVSSVSLHNEDFITGKDLRIGDQVLVERAGDVIPYIVKSLADLRDGSETPIKFPKKCPSCGTKLIRAEDEAAWRCPNASCEAQVLQRMIFHVSKDAMDIDGFGHKQIIRFYELGWLHSIADIYNLDYDAIAELEGLGEKSAHKLRTSIEKAKQNPISRLLHSLSIHHLGKRASSLIAARVKHVLELKDWTMENLTDIPDIGPVVAKNVLEFFSEPKNIRILERMEGLGVNMHQTKDDKPPQIKHGGPLDGKTILFTGTLSQMTREEAEALAANAGAKNISAVSGNLNILVVGEKAGSKLKKAQGLGTVEILSEEEFLKKVKT